MKKKTIIKIVLLIITVIILAFLWEGLTSFFGNPITKMVAKGKINDHLEEKLPGRDDLQIGEIQYNFKTGQYHTEVRSTLSKDTRFNVEWFPNRLIRDSYDDDVASGFNTASRLYSQASKELSSRLEDLGERRVYFQLPERSSLPSYPLDVSYEKELIRATNLTVELKGDERGAENAAKVSSEIFKVIEEEGFILEELDLILSAPDGTHSYQVLNMKVSDAEDKNLLERLLELEEEFHQDPDGSFRREGFKVIIRE